MASTMRSALAAVLLVTACASPTPSGQPAPSGAIASSAFTTKPEGSIDASTPSPDVAFGTLTPLPPAPPATDAPEPRSLPRSVTAEFGGVRLTLSVGLNPLDASYPAGSEALVTLDNRSRRMLEWEVDGCDINAWVSASTESRWRDHSIDLPSPFDEHREELRRSVPFKDPIRLAFLRPIFLLDRDIGCADTAFPRGLPPGRSVTQAFTWDGSALGRLGPAPNGPATLTSRFERWRLAGGDTLRPLEVSLNSWVLNGRREEFLSPFEAIDAAIEDQRFTAWLLSDQVPSNANPLVEFDRDIGLWIIGHVFFRDEDGSRLLHAAYLDPYSGQTLMVNESRVPPLA